MRVAKTQIQFNVLWGFLFKKEESNNSSEKKTGISRQQEEKGLQTGIATAGTHTCSTNSPSGISSWCGGRKRLPPHRGSPHGYLMNVSGCHQAISRLSTGSGKVSELLLLQHVKCSSLWAFRGQRLQVSRRKHEQSWTWHCLKARSTDQRSTPLCRATAAAPAGCSGVQTPESPPLPHAPAAWGAQLRLCSCSEKQGSRSHMLEGVSPQRQTLTLRGLFFSRKKNNWKSQDQVSSIITATPVPHCQNKIPQFTRADISFERRCCVQPQFAEKVVCTGAQNVEAA